MERNNELERHRARRLLSEVKRKLEEALRLSRHLPESKLREPNAKRG